MHEHRRPLILLSGPPGIGKTTAIRAISDRFDRSIQVGFYCCERRIGGKRNGFNIKLLTGEEGLLASPDVASSHRFGTLMPDGHRRLGVNTEFLELTACSTVLSCANTAKLIVIDEIGPMQAVSDMFKSMVSTIFSGRTAVLASIALSDDPWIAAIRRDEAESITYIDHSNRNSTVDAAEQRLLAAGVPGLAPRG